MTILNTIDGQIDYTKEKLAHLRKKWDAADANNSSGQQLVGRQIDKLTEELKTLERVKELATSGNY